MNMLNPSLLSLIGVSVLMLSAGASTTQAPGAAEPDGLTIGMSSALYPSNQITMPDVKFNLLKFRPLASIQGRNQ